MIWFWIALPFIYALVLWIEFRIFTYVGRPRGSIETPPGWKLQRRGLIGRRRWDAYDPSEERWLGWRYQWKVDAARHAWDVYRFDVAVASMNRRTFDL